MKNKNIKIINKNLNGKVEQVISSLQIAEGTKTSHKVVLNLIRNNLSDLEVFGTLTFEKAKSKGRPTTIFFLNEQHSTLTLTYMRNTKLIRNFKIALVKAFYKLRDLAIKNNFVDLTDPIKLRELLLQQTSQVLKLQPKAEAFERLAIKTIGTKCITDAAKELGTSYKILEP
jgi:phage regulator Rha-like protein